MSKELATIQPDVPVEIDVGSAPPQGPTGRDPRDVPDLRAARPAAAPRGSSRRGRCGTAGAVRDPSRCARAGRPGRAVTARRRAPALAAERPQQEEPAQGELLPAEPATLLRFAAYAGGDVIVGEAETLAAVTMGWGERAVVAHDWKSIAAPEEPCPCTPLEHDTQVAAYLLDPAGRAYPLDELLENEGIGVSVKGADGLAQDVVAPARWRSGSVSGSRSSGSRGCCARWSCRSSTCSSRWSGRA